MRLGAIALTALGLLQMLGDLSGLAVLRGLGAATAASPAPRVFSAVDGFETYSTRFFIEWTEPDGSERSVELTSERYARLRGPYNRRNPYGAVVAYGPVLVAGERTRDLFDSVARYAFCGDAPLLAELGLSGAHGARDVRVRLEPLPGSDLGSLPSELVAPCS